MKSNFNPVEIKIHANKDNISLNEQFLLHVNIENTSNEIIENGLFRILLDNNVFEVLDDNLKVCIEDFGYVGNVQPNQNINLDIPIKIKKFNNDQNTIETILNFHMVKDEELVDFNSKSNTLKINIEESNILTENEFEVSTSKKIYFVDEDIDFKLKVKNTGEYTLNNVKISNYIPKDAHMVEDSIYSIRIDKIIYTENEIIITELESKEEIEIYYKVSIDEDIKDLELKLNPKLKYNDKTSKPIEINHKSIYLLLNNKAIFLEDDFTYTINQNEVFEDDIVNHFINIKNNTDTIVSNINLSLDAEDNLNFIKNTLVVNGIYRVGEDINELVILGELEPGEEFNITFDTKVDNLHKTVLSRFRIDYNTNRRAIHQNSNYQEYNLLNPIIDSNCFTKTMDKNNYYVGEICETTIELINLGNYQASKVNLKDIQEDSLDFIMGSLYIDGVKSDIDIFNEGLYLEKLEPNKKINIKYKSKVIDICTNQTTSANIIYFSKNDEKYVSSNNFEYSVIGAKIGNNNIRKSLSSYSAQIGDIITAKIVIENTGNIECESIKIFEDMNNAIEFIEESLYINNEVLKEENIFNGISINQIKPGESILISYQFKILNFPRPNPIIDKTTLTYSFMLDNKLHSNTIYSPKSKLYINNPELIIIDKNATIKENLYSKFCHSQDNLYFSLILENAGNVGLEDINLNLNLPQELILNTESLRINGKELNKPFNNHIKLPNLNVSQRTYLDFFVKHNLSKTYDLESTLYFDYTFRDLKTRLPYKRNLKFKENIFILNPDIEINKFISDQDIEIDREFTKNINLRNSGNIDLYDVKILLNESEFLKESDNTVFVNGSYIDKADVINIEKLEVNETVNIAIRYNINNIPLCESTIPESEVTAKYYLFNENPVPIKRKSNKIKLDIKNYSLDIKGKSNSEILMLDEVYQHTFNIINNGNINCDLLKIDINMPDCFEYVNKSLYINSNNLNINKINTPIPIGDLKCNEAINVSFSFKVKDIPFKGESFISSILYGKYENLDKSIKKTFKSNETKLSIESISLDIVKSASHDYLQTGDILQIQTILHNTGTIDIRDIVLQDNEDDNLVFIENSVYIDGENIEDINPISGIKMPYLGSSENILITYEYEYIPRICSNKVTHFSDITYSYTKKDKTNKNAQIKSDVIYIEGALSTFKQFGIDNEYPLKDYEPDIYDIINTFTDAKVENFYEINSIKNKSCDNSNATGRKVIVKGFVMNRIEYLIESEHSSLYMIERTQPFTVFINLPNDYDGENLYFKAKSDDVFYKTVSKREIFISNLISIEGLL